MERTENTEPTEPTDEKRKQTLAKLDELVDHILAEDSSKPDLDDPETPAEARAEKVLRLKHALEKKWGIEQPAGVLSSSGVEYLGLTVAEAEAQGFIVVKNEHHEPHLHLVTGDE